MSDELLLGILTAFTLLHGCRVWWQGHRERARDGGASERPIVHHGRSTETSECEECGAGSAKSERGAKATRGQRETSGDCGRRGLAPLAPRVVPGDG